MPDRCTFPGCKHPPGHEYAWLPCPRCGGNLLAIIEHGEGHRAWYDHHETDVGTEEYPVPAIGPDCGLDGTILFDDRTRAVTLDAFAEAPHA